MAGSAGVIAAVANLVPKIHVELLRRYDAGELSKAQELQTKLSEADWVLVQLGVAGLKGALDRYYGYGSGRSRKPLGTLAKTAWEGPADEILQKLVDIENSL